MRWSRRRASPRVTGGPTPATRRPEPSKPLGTAGTSPTRTCGTPSSTTSRPRSRRRRGRGESLANPRRHSRSHRPWRSGPTYRRGSCRAATTVSSRWNFSAGSWENVWALPPTRWPAGTSSPSAVRRSWPTAWRHTGRASPEKQMADRVTGEVQDPTKEVAMRKVVAVEFVSVDGVMEAPEEWAFYYTNDEMEEANASGMAASDALLLGRVTYEQMATFWSNQSGGVPMVDYMNTLPKHVVSTTLQELLRWNNSTLISENVAEGITRLKQQPGKDIAILGSGTLVRSLLQDDLLDELRLIIHPIVLGSGKRLFEDGGDRKALELVDSKTFATGVLYLTYRPARREEGESG